ncbi:MAG: 50S ribosomal protein L11 methyltransferase [Chitinophagales bacterium]|nr:50S ribosomal protein L11 methyltransferase [Chitinophagales bacterium]
MANHIEITIPVAETELQQVLIARLADTGFEGFEETDLLLKAFIPEAEYREEELRAIIKEYNLSFTKTVIESQNWNAVWESNFDPVVVDDFVAVRAGFHKPVAGVEKEIVITPKMSFGTGHHATTFMMMRQMRALDFGGKKIIDFGTGTGVLAILAEKMGAADVIAIDYDDWSIDNARENCINNTCSHVHLQLADNAAGAGKADIILANINKNVILDNLEHLKNSLNKNGVLLLSGLLITDEADIVKAALPMSLVLKGKEVMNNWICLVMEPA